MRFKITLVLLAIVVCFGCLQAVWTLQQTGTTRPLYGITFPPGNVMSGFACGESSLVLKTRNGGSSPWSPSAVMLPSGKFSAITFPRDTLFGVIACDSGNVEISPNGQVWVKVNVGTARNLNDLCFVNKDTGYVVGDSGVLRKTLNRGFIWDTLTIPVPNTNLYSVDFLDTRHGWTVGTSGRIFYTFNGGIQWSLQPSGLTATLLSVCFKDTLRGFAVGENNTVLRNGGIGWFQLDSPFRPGTDIYSVYLVPFTLYGYMCGDSGRFARTKDFGNTWDTTTIGNQALYRVLFPQDTLVGYMCGAGGVIYKTVDGGITWIEDAAPRLQAGEKFLTSEPSLFRSATKIKYAYPPNGNATLKIYDCSGGLVRCLALNKSGVASWNGRNDLNRKVSPGVYLLELKNHEGLNQRLKLVVLE